MNEYFRNKVFEFKLESDAMDIHNYGQDPLVAELHSLGAYQLSGSSSLISNVQLQKNQFTSNHALIQLGQAFDYEFIDFKNEKNSVVMPYSSWYGDNQLLFQQTYELSNFAKVTVRKQGGIFPDLIAMIGGLIVVLYLIFRCMTRPIAKFLFHQELTEKLYMAKSRKERIFEKESWCDCFDIRCCGIKCNLCFPCIFVFNCLFKCQCFKACTCFSCCMKLKCCQ